MSKIPVIAIFDVGKTNKKLFLFNEQYQIVYEKTARFLETRDEDGELCENLDSLRLSVFESLNEVLKKDDFDIVAINFSTYGASLVYVDQLGAPLTPLYNYLKPYPAVLEEQFYENYGGKERVALETASPVLGSLNSGMQLYRLKHTMPEVFSRLKYALHLPQYMSYLISGQFYADTTSIGCHTQLWNFKRSAYHDWLRKEDLLKKLPPVYPSDEVIETFFMGNKYKVGAGLHDSSAALIPYLVNFKEPFLLLSTGTWCISLNPFNHTPLTSDELKQDCLSYIGYKGQPVKASRLFSGSEHEQQSKRIAQHFKIDAIIFRNMHFEPDVMNKLNSVSGDKTVNENDGLLAKRSAFVERDLNAFQNATEAYHQLMEDLVNLQYRSTSLVIRGSKVKKIFVDGGFSKNSIFMNLLASAFPALEVYAASMAQATALGTALAIHKHWNSRPLVNDIINLKYYAPGCALPI